MRDHTQTQVKYSSCLVLFSAMAIWVSGDTEGQGSGDQGSKCGGWITLPFMIGLCLCFFSFFLVYVFGSRNTEKL